MSWFLIPIYMPIGLYATIVTRSRGNITGPIAKVDYDEIVQAKYKKIK